MLILLDECVPRKLRRLLAGHEVRTISEMGWAGQKNGQLLRLMAAQSIAVLLTVDRNLRHQQNPHELGISVVVLVAKTNRIQDLAPLVPAALLALAKLNPGEVIEITPN